MNETQAVILAGGIGKRLKPLSFDKNLIKFLSKPLIEYVLDNLIWAGIKKIIIVCNPSNFSFLSSLKKKAKIFCVIQKKPLGMADAILSAKKIVTSAPLLVVNGSDFFDKKVLKEVILEGKKKRIVLTGLEVSSYFPGGYFILKKGKIKGVIEKPGKGKEPSNLVKLVIDYFPEAKKVLEGLEKTKSLRDDVYEVFLDKLISKEKIELVKYKGFWGYIKYPWDILGMMNIFLQNQLQKSSIDKNVSVSPKATLEGKVSLAEGVKIFEGAKVRGPCYIGKNTIIGNNALVRESMIGENCVIGYNTEIVRSFIGDNCWFHANYIGDSVLEENISFGSGARTANLRLDEEEIFVKKEGENLATGRVKLGAIIAKNVRVGINTSIMPGITIGRDSFVGPGLILNKNLGEKVFCYLKERLIIKKNLFKIDLKQRKKFREKI